MSYFKEIPKVVYAVYDTRNSNYTQGTNKTNPYFLSLGSAKGFVSRKGINYKDQDRYVIHQFELVRIIDKVED